MLGMVRMKIIMKFLSIALFLIIFTNCNYDKKEISSFCNVALKQFYTDEISKSDYPFLDTLKIDQSLNLHSSYQILSNSFEEIFENVASVKA